MNTYICNDLHIGVQRSGGTTPKSAAALRAYAHEQHRTLMAHAKDGDRVIVNGDLTDTFDLELSDTLEVYWSAAQFLTERQRSQLIWCVGNHDLSKDSSKLGTVAFIGALLESAFPRRFQLVTEPTDLSGDIYVIPHLTNQSLFELALDAVPDGTKYLLLHCNFDNPFAGQQDHSLNLTRDRVAGFRDRGITVVLAHEHQGRTAFAGKLIVVGNQFPTSIADCLSHGEAQVDGRKRLMVIRPDGGHEFVTTWSRDGAYGAKFAEVPWSDTVSAPEDAMFIRITGRAEAEQAADVASAISKLRQRHGAYVITNAVQVAQVDTPEVSESLEDIRTLDVFELLLEHLTPDQQTVVRRIKEEAAC